MKYLHRINLPMILLILILCSPLVYGGWFGSGDDQRASQQRREEVQYHRLAEAELRTIVERQAVENPGLAAAYVSAGVVLLNMIGTVLGTPTRHEVARPQF